MVSYGANRILWNIYNNPILLKDTFKVMNEYVVPNALEQVKTGLDYMWIAEDLGFSSGPFFSLEQYREFVHPFLKQLVDEVRRVRKDLPIAFHCCGNFKIFIEDMIDLGIQAINPFQRTATWDLKEVKKKVGVRIVTDVHLPEQVKYVKDVVDIIQIPAFLCRQTDLIVAAAKTKKPINIKKGQFLGPDDVKYIIDKVTSTGNKKILLTERGSCFGYNNLIVDFRSFLIMKKFGYPVIFDATHSLQRPSASAGISGGDREFVSPLAKAAVACGVDGIFMEVHPNPKLALSDKHTSFPLNKLDSFLKEIFKIREVLDARK